jgi:hypothetical protein
MFLETLPKVVQVAPEWVVQVGRNNHESLHIKIIAKMLGLKKMTGVEHG